MTTPFTASFCSLNVRGLNQARKRRQLFRWLQNNKFDIVFLQETYSSKYIENPWKSEWGGKIYFCHGTSHSRGVMIMFNPKLDVLVDNIEVIKTEGICFFKGLSLIPPSNCATSTAPTIVPTK